MYYILYIQHTHMHAIYTLHITNTIHVVYPCVRYTYILYTHALNFKNKRVPAYILLTFFVVSRGNVLSLRLNRICTPNLERVPVPTRGVRIMTDCNIHAFEV